MLNPTFDHVRSISNFVGGYPWTPRKIPKSVFSGLFQGTLDTRVLTHSHVKKWEMKVNSWNHLEQGRSPMGQCWPMGLYQQSLGRMTFLEWSPPTDILAFYLTCILTKDLAFYLSILSDTCIYIYISIQLYTHIQSTWCIFWHSIWHSSRHSIWHLPFRTWGPSVPTEQI